MRDSCDRVPILVLGSGQRCGSTLVQRLLSSHPDTLIWGEHEAQLAELLGIVRTLHARERKVGGEARSAYEQDRHQSFMANAMPDAAAVSDAAREFVAALFARPAAARGRARWGFKETSYGRREAEGLRALFPELRVVHVTRDPRAVLSSLDAWERADSAWRREHTERALRDWTAVNESFADPPPWVASYRYEDVVDDPERFVRGLGEHLELDHRLIDREVFAIRVHGSGDGGGAERALRRFEDLPPDLRALADDERLRSVAPAYGYRPRR